jgi:uncharacterized protein (TIGR02246 family)
MDDERAIARVIALYSQLVDSKRFDEWADLFTENARFVARGHAFEGRDTIVSTISSMMASAVTKHLVGPPVVDVDGDRAHAWTDLTTFTGGADGIGIATIGRYYDDFERGADGRWRLSSRVLVLTGEVAPDDVTAAPAR